MVNSNQDISKRQYRVSVYITNIRDFRVKSKWKFLQNYHCAGPSPCLGRGLKRHCNDHSAVVGQGPKLREKFSWSAQFLFFPSNLYIRWSLFTYILFLFERINLWRFLLRNLWAKYLLYYKFITSMHFNWPFQYEKYLVCHM